MNRAEQFDLEEKIERRIRELKDKRDETIFGDLQQRYNCGIAQLNWVLSLIRNHPVVTVTGGITSEQVKGCVPPEVQRE